MKMTRNKQINNNQPNKKKSLSSSFLIKKKKLTKEETKILYNATIIKDRIKFIANNAFLEAWQGPERKATHWDSLISEMKWMSTDFKYEFEKKKELAKKIAEEAKAFSFIIYHQERNQNKINILEKIKLNDEMNRMYKEIFIKDYNEKNMNIIKKYEEEKALDRFKIIRRNFTKKNGYDIFNIPELVDVSIPSISTVKNNLKQAIIQKIRNNIVKDVETKYKFLCIYDNHIPKWIQSLRFARECVLNSLTQKDNDYQMKLARLNKKEIKKRIKLINKNLEMERQRNIVLRQQKLYNINNIQISNNQIKKNIEKRVIIMEKNNINNVKERQNINKIEERGCNGSNRGGRGGRGRKRTRVYEERSLYRIFNSTKLLEIFPESIKKLFKDYINQYLFYVAGEIYNNGYIINDMLKVYNINITVDDCKERINMIEMGINETIRNSSEKSINSMKDIRNKSTKEIMRNSVSEVLAEKRCKSAYNIINTNQFKRKKIMSERKYKVKAERTDNQNLVIRCTAYDNNGKLLTIKDFIDNKKTIKETIKKTNDELQIGTSKVDNETTLALALAITSPSLSGEDINTKVSKWYTIPSIHGKIEKESTSIMKLKNVEENALKNYDRDKFQNAAIGVLPSFSGESILNLTNARMQVASMLLGRRHVDITIMQKYLQRYLTKQQIISVKNKATKSMDGNLK